MQIRLDRFVSEGAGVARSEARRLILSAEVTVDGQVVKKIDKKVDEDATNIRVNQMSIEYNQFIYIMLNKPLGVVSAREDKRDVTVTDLVKKDYPKRQLFPAGRLDKNSTGFILLTDDGRFAHDILAPKNHLPKTYIVEIDAPLTQEVILGFSEGVTLVDGTLLKPAAVTQLENDQTIEVVLSQGVYHQIKRMLGVFDIGVNKLHRTAIGKVMLDATLKPGEYRKLTTEEISSLKGEK